MKKFILLASYFFVANAYAQTPLEQTKRIANYIVSNTPFQYKLEVFKPSHKLTDLQSIDFSRSLQNRNNAVGLAYTEFISNTDTTITLELSHSGALQITVNDNVIYSNVNNNQLKFEFLERSIVLEKQIQITLKKGVNTVLFKSVTTDTNKDWKILFQSTANTVITLEHCKQLNREVNTLSNFLISGGFVVANATQAFQTTYEVEKNKDLATVYEQNGYKYTWTLPKVELTQNVIDPQPYWGSFYNYNYHTAGVAWAIAELGRLTGDKKYNDFTTNYCNFVLKAKPFVTYQVRELWQTNSTDYLIVNTPLLDFTSAPAMPFLYKLIHEPAFKERTQYNDFFQQIKSYIFNKQVRLPEGNFTRETPEKYTTWVDDMFMGLPFVIHCASETKDPKEKKRFQDDAANQVLAFAKVLFDPKDSLFHHARHTSRPNVQYPYWLRANGWGIWAITEVLKGLPKNHPQYNKIMNLYKAHITALAKHQDESGMWHNIVNIPTARLETSGSSIIALAIARGVNEGWLDKATYKPIAEKAWNAICKRIEPDGQVHDIIVGSFTSEDYKYYENQPFVKNDSHGMLCVLMCGIEMSKLMQQDNYAVK